MPTNQDAIDERLDVMQKGYDLFRTRLGEVAVVTSFSTADDPYTWSPSQEIIVQDQVRVYGLAQNANDILLPDNTEFRARDNQLVEKQLGQLVGLLYDWRHNNLNLIPDVQGRGANLLLVRAEDGQSSLSYVDMSPFVKQAVGMPNIHPLGTREENNTLKRIDQYEAWLKT